MSAVLSMPLAWFSGVAGLVVVIVLVCLLILRLFLVLTGRCEARA